MVEITAANIMDWGDVYDGADIPTRYGSVTVRKVDNGKWEVIGQTGSLIREYRDVQTVCYLLNMLRA